MTGSAATTWVSAALQLGDADAALDWAYKALRCTGTVSLGHDLAGRARMKLGAISAAVLSFENAVRANRNDTVAADHLMLALYAADRQPAARRQAEQRMASDPTALVPRAVLSLDSDESMGRFANTARGLLGEDDFEMLETSLVFAEFGLIDESQRIVKAACVEAVPPAQRSFMPLYYLAWLDSLRGAIGICAEVARMKRRDPRGPRLCLASRRNPDAAVCHRAERERWASPSAARLPAGQSGSHRRGGVVMERSCAAQRGQHCLAEPGSGRGGEE